MHADTHHKQLFVKNGKNMLRIKLCDIVMMEGSDHFVKIVTIQKKYHLSKSRLKDIEEKITGIAEQSFCRVNRSYIINLNHVDEVNDNVIQMGQSNVCLHKSYYVMFFTRLLVI